MEFNILVITIAFFVFLFTLCISCCRFCCRSTNNGTIEESPDFTNEYRETVHPAFVFNDDSESPDFTNEPQTVSVVPIPNYIPQPSQGGPPKYDDLFPENV